MSKCGVFVRMVYDAPYMNAFLHHYLNLGFHKIFMLFNENFLEGKNIKVRVTPSHPPSLEKTKCLSERLDFIFSGSKFFNLIT